MYSSIQKESAWARDRTPHRRAHIPLIDAAVTARAHLRSDISNLRTGITKHQRGCGDIRDEKKGQKAHGGISLISPAGAISPPTRRFSPATAWLPYAGD